MRIVFFGSSRFGLPTFDSIRGDGHEIALVVTQPDKPRGRHLALSPTVIHAAADEAGLPVICPGDVNAPDVVERIRACRADVGYVAAFGQKIGVAVREAFAAGAVNLHGSLLPAWRGAAPVQRAVMNGDVETGVTVFRLVDRMDAGPTLVQRRTAIGEDETADELHDRLAHIGCDAVRAALALLSRDPKTHGVAQDESAATRAPKLTKADGLIRFDAPAARVAHRICGLWSWPGAQCRFVSEDGRRDERVTLARARTCEARPGQATRSSAAGDSGAAAAEKPGSVTDVLGVQAGDGEINILEIKPSGGRLMNWPDYVNGRHVRPGDRFVPLEVGAAEDKGRAEA
jgi:methionyl-tRNA formyltransferase